MANQGFINNGNYHKSDSRERDIISKGKIKLLSLGSSSE